MPELPEVETIRRDLQYVVTGKGVRSVDVFTPKIVGGNAKAFIAALTGNRIDSLGRRGKLLICTLGYGKQTLLIHLKMTGQLLCEIPGGLIVGGHPAAKIDDLPNEYTHVGLTFSDQTKLYFNDVRMFGYLRLAGQDELERVLNGFGIEPLTPAFTWDAFARVFANRRAPLKSLLLNQALVAGIGNIYADEICYQARLRPDRSAADLSLMDLKRLYSACTRILGQAVKKRGTTFSNYVDASGKKGGYFEFLKVYNRKGERCFRCGDDRIVKTRVAGRGTHLCESCQR